MTPQLLAVDDPANDAARRALGWGTEALMVGGGAAFVDAALAVPPTIGWPALVVGAGATVGLRDPLARALRRSHLQRKWHAACRDCNVPPSGVRRSVRIPIGDVLYLDVPRGSSVRQIEQRTEELAAALGVRDLRVVRDPKKASRANVVLDRFDPFDGAEPIPWPLADATQTDIWKPMPIGVDEYGEPVCLPLVGYNLLVGGVTGGGKSVLLSMIAAYAALCPNAKLWLFDAKILELDPWAASAVEFAGPDIKDAAKKMRMIRDEVDERYEELQKRPGVVRKIAPEQGLPIHVVIIDELAEYFNQTGQAAKDFASDVLSVASRGRAAGIPLIAATQRPSHDIIPTTLRAQFARRLALRCTDPETSDTILNKGMAHRGSDASTIPEEQKGVGYLLAEGSVPKRLRNYYLSDSDIERLRDVAKERAINEVIDRATAAATP